MDLKLDAVHHMVSPEFKHPFVGKITKINEKSVMADILSVQDGDFAKAYQKNNAIVVSKKSVGKLIKKGTREQKFAKRAPWNGQSNKAKQTAKLVLMKNNNVVEKFASIKQASTALGVDMRTIKNSLSSDKTIIRGNLKGCKFELLA